MRLASLGALATALVLGMLACNTETATVSPPPSAPASGETPPSAPVDASTPDAPAAPLRRVGAVPDSVRTGLALSSFYQRYTDVDGFAIVSSSKVADEALLEAAWVIEHLMAKRPEILAALSKARVRFVPLAPTEMQTDLPEYADLWPQSYWNKRARGLGATEDIPLVSAGAENLLSYKGDPYVGESITIHEFSHAIHLMGLSTVDPSFDGRLEVAYAAAIKAGKWAGTYAGTNYQEYWAEGVQSWFDGNVQNNPSHNDINTRAELRTYDPALAALLTEVFGDDAWRYTPASARVGTEHLAGFDRASAPTFRWPTDIVDPVDDGSIPALAVASPATLEASGTGSTPAAIFFANRSSARVGVEWVDYAGKRTPWFWLEPNEDNVVYTFNGNVWTITDQAAALTGVVVASSRAKVVLR